MAPPICQKYINTKYRQWKREQIQIFNNKYCARRNWCDCCFIFTLISDLYPVAYILIHTFPNIYTQRWKLLCVIMDLFLLLFHFTAQGALFFSNSVIQFELKYDFRRFCAVVVPCVRISGGYFFNCRFSQLSEHSFIKVLTAQSMLNFVSILSWAWESVHTMTEIAHLLNFKLILQ